MTTYTLPITQKGQLTIPKKERDLTGLKPGYFVNFRLVDKVNFLYQIKPTPSLLSMGKLAKAPRGKNALKGREAMDKNYSPA